MATRSRGGGTSPGSRGGGGTPSETMEGGAPTPATSAAKKPKRKMSARPAKLSW